MITNPYIPSPSAANAWVEGFVKGFAGPEYSTKPPPEIANEDVTAFSEGIIAGQQSAIDGLVFSDACISAGESDDNQIDEAGHLIDAAHILRGVWEARHLAKLAGGLAGIAVGFIVLAATLPVSALPAEQVLPNLGQPIADALSAYGVGSLELFCATGLDATNKDCEILLSPMYKSLDEARQAATQMGRNQWTIASWRTDACSSFRIVESS